MWIERSWPLEKRCAACKKASPRRTRRTQRLSHENVKTRNGHSWAQETGNMTSQPVLVIGGTRGTGLLIVRLLHEQGVLVRVLALDPGRAVARFGPTADVIPGDITKEDTLPRAQGQHSHMAPACGGWHPRERPAPHDYSNRDVVQPSGRRKSDRRDPGGVAPLAEISDRPLGRRRRIRRRSRSRPSRTRNARGRPGLR